MDMTIYDFAKMLNGGEYGNEISPAEEELAKSLGFIVVTGYSDDNCEIYGAFRDEYGCFGGGIIEDKRLPKPIEAVWCDKERDCAWSYKTEMPHAEFNIYEDGELYCVGIVVDSNIKNQSKEQLKPCPKCNTSWLYVSEGDYGSGYESKGYKVNCQCGNAWETTSFVNSREKAITDWNKQV